MMWKNLVAFVVFSISLPVAGQFNPQIVSVKRWGQQYGAQVSSIDVKSQVSSLVARTILTISFRDVLSTAEMDSMEVSFNFNLPQKSVIDSMYLWINGVPQPAALKEWWSAVSAYWQVVGRRWDPALLTKQYGDRYSLRVFPFSHGEERTVRICYSTPVEVEDGHLAIRYPIDIASGSIQPVTKITGRVSVEGHQERVAIRAEEGFTTSTEYDAARTISVITFSARNLTPTKTFVLTIPNAKLSETGMYAYSMRKDKADASFLAILEPRSAIGLSNSRPKNILVLWNMVTFQRGCSWEYYHDEYKCTPFENLAYDYDPYYVPKVLSALESFISKYLQAGDKLNIVFNDGSMQSVYPSQHDWSSTMATEVLQRMQNTIDHEMKNEGCLKPQTFLTSAISLAGKSKPLDLILIDQTYSYDYSTAIDTHAIDSVKSVLLNLLPQESTVFGLIGYSWSNPIARIQNGLIEQRKGTAFYSWGDFQEIFSSIGRSLTPQIYPASVSFSTSDGSFIYDITGPVDNRIYFGLPVVYTGKIRGATSSLTMRFTYDINGTVYDKQRTFSINPDNVSFDPIEKIWAASKINRLISQWGSYYAQNEYSEALNMSLAHRILTQQTALIAFEPGLMADSWYTDDKPKNTGTTFGTLVEYATATAKPSLSMETSVRNQALNICITGMKQTAITAGISLKIYTASGRLVADLSKSVAFNGKSLVAYWKPQRVSSGMYIVRFVLGTTVMQKTVYMR